MAAKDVSEKWVQQTLDARPELVPALRVLNEARPATRTVPARIPKGEFDVLVGAARGETIEETAERLGFSTESVVILRQYLRARLDVPNTQRAVLAARRLGILTGEEDHDAR